MPRMARAVAASRIEAVAAAAAEKEVAAVAVTDVATVAVAAGTAEVASRESDR